MDRHSEKEARARRLVEARRSAGFTSAKQAAERWGWKLETYKAHENGRNGFDNDSGRLYAKAFRVTLAWLMTGEDGDDLERVPFLPEDEPAPIERGGKGSAGYVSNAGIRSVEQGEIPQIDAQYGLGYTAPPEAITVEIRSGQSVDAIPIVGSWRIPSVVISRYVRTRFENLHFMECDGESMEPRIKDGDIVLIDQTKTNPAMPGIFALREMAGLTIKNVEIVHGSMPVRLRLIPENKKYESYEVDADEVAIIGRYVARFTAD